MDWLNFFRIVGYIALTFGAICTIGVDILKNKKDTTDNENKQQQMTELMTDVKDSKKLLEPFTLMANKLYPELDQKEALEKLQGRIDSLDKTVNLGVQNVTELKTDLSKETKTIKSFDAILSVEFSGKWDNPPYSMWIEFPQPKTFLKWTGSSDGSPNIEFTSSKIKYETVNSNTGLFKNTLIIQPGQFPLGQLTDILKNYTGGNFSIILSWPENLLEPTVRINRVDIVFSINGTKKGELHYQPNFLIDYSEALKGLIPGKANVLQPSIDFNGKPVDIFKMNL